MSYYHKVYDLVARIPRGKAASYGQLALMTGSPRASRALFRPAGAWAAMAGRSFVTPDDIQALIHPVLAHRLLLTNEARLSGVTADGVLDQIAAQLPVPPAAGDEFHGA